MMRSTVGAVLAAMVASGTALAQTNVTCKGKVFVHRVFQAGPSGDRYEYFLQLRNSTSVARSWTLTFSGFPEAITLSGPVLAGNPVPANQVRTMRFGVGTDNTISAATVAIDYDTEGTGGMRIKVAGCGQAG